MDGSRLTDEMATAMTSQYDVNAIVVSFENNSLARWWDRPLGGMLDIHPESRLNITLTQMLAYRRLSDDRSVGRGRGLTLMTHSRTFLCYFIPSTENCKVRWPLLIVE